jgi:hypothetical protein
MSTVWAILTIGVIVLIFIGGPAVVGGILLGVLSTLAFTVLYVRMPKVLKLVILKFHLIVDIGMTILVYKLMASHTATALIGASVNCILISFFLMHEREKGMGNRDIRNVLNRINV